MSLKIIFIFGVSLALVSSTAVDFEEKLRSFLKTEVREFSKKGLGVSTRSTGSSLTTSERDILLQLHNDARQSVNPPAANMPEMIWSNELASIAQNYANQCIWAHNSERSSQSSSFYYVGENIYVTTATSGYLQSGIASWVNEKEDYDYATNTCGNVCGHYTQVVWDESTKLGCAVTVCPTMTNLPTVFTNTRFLVCNYGPGGNYVGQKPYVEGTGSPNNIDTNTVCKWLNLLGNIHFCSNYY